MHRPAIRRPAALAAAVLAVAVPVAVVLVVRATPGRPAATGCDVRYTAAAGGVLLTVTLAQPGSVEVRDGDRPPVTRDEPSGTSTLTLPGPAGGLAVTEYTADGELIACTVTAR